MLEEVTCKAEQQMTGAPFIYGCTVIRHSEVQTCSKPPTCSGRTDRLRTHCKRVAWRLAA
jgi:hypothetical protein